MLRVGLSSNASFEDWRAAARQLLTDGIEPHEVDWSSENSLSLSDAMDSVPRLTTSAVRVPRDFLRLAMLTSLHRDERRFAVLYRLLWRMQREPRLLADALDEDVDAVTRMAKAVRRDIHKMKAFVRFREVQVEGATWLVAWFEPEHHIVAITAPFFARR